MSLVFLSSAGFLLLHALATPQILLTGRNAGFAIATPVGLLLASVFAVVSSSINGPMPSCAARRCSGRPAGADGRLGGGVAAGAAAAGHPLLEEASRGPLTVEEVAVAGVALYTLACLLLAAAPAAAVGHPDRHPHRLRAARRGHDRCRPGLQLARLLVGVAPADGVRLRLRLLQRPRAVRQEGSWSSLFHGIYLQETIGQIRREHAAALEALVEAMQASMGNGARPIGRVVADLADRFDLTEGQAEVLEQAAQALVAEREQIERLRALVAVGAEARVIVDERQLLERGSS